MFLAYIGAEVDHLQVVAPTATKAANYPQIFPYPPKEGWWAVAIVKKAMYLQYIWFTT